MSLNSDRAVRRSSSVGLTARAALVVFACLIGLSSVATPSAFAASPLKVREVFSGTAAAPLAEYVQLQMTGDGQNDVDGQVVSFYDASGSTTPVATFTLPTDVASGQSQRTVLLATAEAGTLLGGDAAAPDFTLPSVDRIGQAGGAVCFTGAVGADDCVTWGSIPAMAAPFPDPQSGNAAALGIPNGMALRRSIAPGCSTYLDAPDDSDDGADNFAAVAPAPRRNATAPTETRCPPDTSIGTFPTNPSNDPSPAFGFSASPTEPGVEFECELDGDGSFATAVACNSGSISYSGLGDGQHVFRVRAVGEGGPDPTPATRTWTIDTEPPETGIGEVPPSPNSGFSVKFGYSSSEPFSSFRCQLDGEPVGGQVCGTSSSSGSKSYFGLSDGAHVFRVWAIDNAGNVDPVPAEFGFEVQTSIGDRTPPDTSIVSTPPNPARTSTASFAYASSEAGSRFECSLDGAAFAACPAGGSAYRDLPNGDHSFAVRAIDVANNTDSVPASYSWRVAARAPSVRFTKAPGGAVRAPDGKRSAAVEFGFAASEAGSSFRCRLDLKGAFQPCRSPHSFSASAGRHVFEVFAVDRLGNQGSSSFRIFRVRAEGERRAFFVQRGTFLSSLTAEVSPTTLPREGLRPISLSIASTFENLDGSAIPPLRTMDLQLARGGVIETEGLPRCTEARLRLRNSKEALRACRAALVGRGTIETAVRFPEGARLRASSPLLLFNAGRQILMHVDVSEPVEGNFVIPLELSKGSGLFGTRLRATFPQIAADFGQVTGFSMTMQRAYRFRGERRSYLLGRCPIPRGAGVNRLSFELARVDYRFGDGLRIRNSSINDCRATG